MSFDLYPEETAARADSLKPMKQAPTDTFDNFFSGAGNYAMQGFAKTARAVDLLGSVGPIVHDKISGGTEAQDKYFKEHDEVFGNAVDYWTPKPGEVGVAGEVVGQLLGTLPQVFMSPSLAVASAQLSTAEDLTKQGVDATRANAAGAIQASGLGFGVWMPILGKTLAQRVLAGGVGFNVVQGVAMRGATGAVLDGTPAEGSYKALDGKSITLDVLLGAAFGGMAHINPAMRAQGDEFHARFYAWAKNIRPSQVDALVTLKQAEHINVDSMPGKPVDLVDTEAHVQRTRQAINDLANDRPVNVENMPEPKFGPDTARHVASNESARAIADEGFHSGAISEYDYQTIRDDVIGDLPRGVVQGGKKSIREVIDFAKNGAANEKRGVRFARVDDAAAATIKESTGADVSGYIHMIDNFGIRHALNEHGNPDVEARRGNIAITENDILKVPEIIKSYDRVENGGTDTSGRSLVRYIKTDTDGTIYYVEEIRSKRKELALKTMWKKPAARGMLPGEPTPTPLTSETLRGFGQSIGQVEPIVNIGKPLLQEIKKMGGVNIKELRDITGEARTGKGIKGIPIAFFTKQGRGLDDLATMLKDEGYNIDTNAVDGGVEQLRGMIRDSLDGTANHAPMESQFAEFERMYRERMYQEYEPTPDELALHDLRAHDTQDAAMVSRAASIDEGVVERLAVQHADDDAAFMGKIREFLNEKDTNAKTAGTGKDNQSTQETTTTSPTDAAIKTGLDPIHSEAARFAAENPDLHIVIGKNADGSDIISTPRKMMEDADNLIKITQEDAKLFEVAAGCIMGAN